MDPQAAYAAKRDRTVAQIDAARRDHATVGLRKSTSNLFRQRDRMAARRIDVRSFDKVLNVDRERLLADVEGMATYKDVVDATLRYGALPLVTPQLKTITIGGAVAGLGIESSSFRHGLVHETVADMEILTGDARVVTCSRSENQDLFHGFPNSYGTLGYALRLRIRLMAAKRFVRLTHTRFTDPNEYFSALETCCNGSADFVDGTAFSPFDLYITIGEFVDEAPFHSDYTYARIYYKSIARKAVDYLTARDYIWRWDTDWFWCSKQFYLQHPAVRLLATKWLLNSETYQRIMRLSQKLMPSSNGTESVIQDVDIPIGNSERFFHFLFEEIGITPVWICPFRTSAHAQYSLYPLRQGELYVNFGFWDIIPSGREPGYFNRKIEARVLELDGKKSLYSSSYYDTETFWRIYGKPCYDRLRAKYDPAGTFPGLYEKCVQRH